MSSPVLDAWKTLVKGSVGKFFKARKTMSFQAFAKYQVSPLKQVWCLFLFMACKNISLCWGWGGWAGEGRGSAPCLVHIVAAAAAVLSLCKHVWSTLTAVGAVPSVFLPALGPKGIKSCSPASVSHSQSALRNPTCGAFLCACATWFEANTATACGFRWLPACLVCSARNRSLFLYKIPQFLLHAPPLKTLEHD